MNAPEKVTTWQIRRAVPGPVHIVRGIGELGAAMQCGIFVLTADAIEAVATPAELRTPDGPRVCRSCLARAAERWS